MADQTTETVNQQKPETITKQKNPLRVKQKKTYQLNITILKKNNVSICMNRLQNKMI